MKAQTFTAGSNSAAVLHAKIPPYKSEVNRWLILMAQLPDLKLRLPAENLPEDCQLMLAALEKIGFQCVWDGELLRLSPPLAYPDTPIELNIKRCGTCARFLLPLLSTLPGRFLLDGDARMRQRPLQPLVKALSASGAVIKKLSSHELPLLIDGKGSNLGAIFQIDTSDSSQFLTALLLLALTWRAETSIEVEGDGSSSFSGYTIQLLRSIGIWWEKEGTTPKTYKFKNTSQAPHTILPEADWAAASYWLAMSQLTQRELRLEGLSLHSQQPDAKALTLYRNFGFQFETGDQYLRVQPPAELPNNIALDATDFPDLVPGFAIWFALNARQFIISGLGRLSKKESNRLKALQTHFEILGSELKINSRAGDVRIVWRGGQLRSPLRAMPTFGDHRIALAASLLLNRFNQIQLEAPRVVVKSYPDWWEQLHGNHLLTPLINVKQ